MSVVSLAFAAIALLAAAKGPEAQAASSQVASLERRGQAGIEPVEVVRWDRDGLELRRAGAGGSTAIVRWDQIRAVEGLPAETGEARRFGEQLWRACTRLERGDHALAAPLFEGLAEAFRNEGSLRERLAIEGVLRTRVRSGDAAAAILAALRAVELDRAGVLLPPGAIAPADRIASLDWPEGAAILPLEGLLEADQAEALLDSLRAFAVPERSVATEAAAIAEATLGRRIAPIDESDRSTLAALLVRLGGVRERSPQALLAERERLLEDASPPSVERWWQAHLGERLLADPTPSIQRRGLLEWLAVAAGRPGSPEARIALRRAVLAADALGEDDLADRLAGLASDTFPPAFLPSAPPDSGIRP